MPPSQAHWGGSGVPGLFVAIFGVRLYYYDMKKISNFQIDYFRFFCPKFLICAKMLDLPPLPEPAETTKTRVRGIYSPGSRNVLQMAPVCFPSRSESSKTTKKINSDGIDGLATVARS